MIARSSTQSRQTLSINIPVVFTITKGTCPDTLNSQQYYRKGGGEKGEGVGSLGTRSVAECSAHYQLT